MKTSRRGIMQGLAGLFGLAATGARPPPAPPDPIGLNVGHVYHDGKLYVFGPDGEVTVWKPTHASLTEWVQDTSFDAIRGARTRF